MFRERDSNATENLKMPTFTSSEHERIPISPESNRSQDTATPFTPVNTPGSEITSWTDDEALQYVIYIVVQMKKEKDDSGNTLEAPLYRALTENGISSLKIFCRTSDEQISKLQFIGVDRKKTTLNTGQQILAGQCRDFVIWQYKKRKSFSNNVWRDNHIDHDDFNRYMCIHQGKEEPETNDEGSIKVKPPVVAKKQDPVNDFKKTIKRDKANYPVLEDDKMWLVFHRKFIIIANIEGMERQIDPSYYPRTTEDKELDAIENKYFYGVLDHCIKTDKGKQIIKKYGYPEPKARDAWVELNKYMASSTKAKFMKQELLESLQLTKFTRNSNMTAEHFLALYLQKFRALDELTEYHERLPDSQRFMFLYNALSDIEDFRQIRQTMDIHEKPDNYEMFLSMAEKAAVIYDKNNSKVKVKHNINETNVSPFTYMLDDNEEDILYQEGEYEEEEMIDLDELVINKLSQQPWKKKFQPGSSQQQDQPFKRLSIELWKQLDQNAKNTIMTWLQKNKEAPSKPQPKPPYKPNPGFKRSVNNHEIDSEEMVDENQDQDTDDPQDSDALLSLLMSQSEEDQASLANVLSAFAAKRGKAKGFTPPTTKQVKFNVLY